MDDVYDIDGLVVPEVPTVVDDGCRRSHLPRRVLAPKRVVVCSSCRLSDHAHRLSHEEFLERFNSARAFVGLDVNSLTRMKRQRASEDHAKVHGVALLEASFCCVVDSEQDPQLSSFASVVNRAYDGIRGFLAYRCLGAVALAEPTVVEAPPRLPSQLEQSIFGRYRF